MEFEKPEELKMIQSAVHDFVSEQLKPLERTVLGRAADISDAQMYLPADEEQGLTAMAKEMGLWGIGLPEELGGAGLGTLGACLIEEELAQTVVPFSFGDVPPVLFECSEQQREDYLKPALERQKYPLFALLEPGGKSNAEDLQTKADKKDDHYELTGDKLTFSRIGDRNFAVVFALTNACAPLREGVSCFLVDQDTQGFQLRGNTERTGWEARVRRPTLLQFDHCRLGVENLLGAEGKAFHLAGQWLPARRIVRAARSVGAALRILDECTVQAQTWTSFGQGISGRPSVQASLGDIAAHIHAARLVVYEAAWKADQGQMVKREAAMAKLVATQMIHFVADNAAHIFNGPAYVAGLPVERFCRNAVAGSLTDQSLQLQRNIIAKDVLRGLRL
ncbi:acyl-CoA dehydrogenase family protein [Chloroflexota bacterium]